MEATINFRGPEKSKEMPIAMRNYDKSLQGSGKHDIEEGLTSELISAGSENLQRKGRKFSFSQLAVPSERMGASLLRGGPAGLFLAFVVYGSVIWCVNQCLAAEMVTYLPIASPFIRLSGFWVNDAWGFAMGWIYFFLMLSLFRTKSQQSTSF
ncbi:hypothetical protein N7478_012550 [Penicillium angulare]|uniref:uncharacterized protein n=1 Tax=Penicillium angulare TaxID=116970 RepID=UPI002542668C|nr:uncharacterized protein N7478_012550 [Penicillium angulare]KAJ5259569.1 hypothetical protein N7478_012550 [Penicillium angulare]